MVCMAEKDKKAKEVACEVIEGYAVGAITQGSDFDFRRVPMTPVSRMVAMATNKHDRAELDKWAERIMAKADEIERNTEKGDCEYEA